MLTSINQAGCFYDNPSSPLRKYDIMTVTLAYNSSTRTFTASVTANPGGSVQSVTLSSPGGTIFQMMHSAGGNPSTWTVQLFTDPAAGVWTATATGIVPISGQGTFTV